MGLIIEDLSEDEAYLWSLISDPSGLDLAEFCWVDHEAPGGVWRAWPFQWKWFRSIASRQIDQSARSVGKSLSIKLRAFCFPFIHPGQEMVITAPELVHLNPIVGLVENQFRSTRLGREMLPRGRNQGITHRPFQCDFLNGSRIIGRIPQRDGKGIKGCVEAGVLVLTKRGLLPVESVRVGDEVWSHRLRWSPVREVHPVIDEGFYVTGQGSFPVTVSSLHQFYVRKDKAKQPGKDKRRLGEFSWERVSDLHAHAVKFAHRRKWSGHLPFYWSGPELLLDPAMSVPGIDWSSWNGNVREFDTTDIDFWWLVGRWLADGYVSSERSQDQVRRGRVHWIAHPRDQDSILKRLEMRGLSPAIKPRSHSSADDIEICSSPFVSWLTEHFGHTAYHKRLPVWAFFMAVPYRQSLLDGYWSGDANWDGPRGRHAAGSASKELALGIGMVAMSLGLNVGYSETQINVTEIMGVPLKKQAATSYRVRTVSRGHAIRDDGYFSYKIRDIVPVGEQEFWNIISDDHSYVGDGIFHHNTHPLWLEHDEAQDYPDPGWTEILETVKRGHEGAVWRAHGVTKGVRDYFYKFTQPESGWHVHRVTAMHRPTWTAEEREQKIEEYGSREHPDYRRNILGLHGDATNPIFVLHRLMQCVDQDQESDYNSIEYYKQSINAEYLEDRGGMITTLLDYPSSHKQTGRSFWAGCDVGYTNHPSEILVFAQERPNKQKQFVLRLVSRIHLERISHGAQVEAILHTINFYNLKAFAMDKTGLGLPLFQDIQERAPQFASIIKGYNFSGKILVDFDQTVDIDEFRDTQDDIRKKAGIERNVVEYATDKLREFVDSQRLILPWDRDLIGEFQGQTYVVVRDTMNQYGKKSYSQGTFHALDAARMAVLGLVQQPIEDMTKADTFEPVPDVFFGEW